MLFMNVELLVLAGACVLSVLIVYRSFMPLHGKMPLQTITDHSSNNPTIQTTKNHIGEVSVLLCEEQNICVDIQTFTILLIVRIEQLNQCGEKKRFLQNACLAQGRQVLLLFLHISFHPIL